MPESSTPRKKPEPLFSGKCDVSAFICCNPRKIVDTHVEHLAAEMRQSVKDMQYPIFACVTSSQSERAKNSLKERYPFACKIVVRQNC